jgi:hypothetical protein
VFLNPEDLDLAQIEEIEKASARLVTQAIYEFRNTAAEIFNEEKDLAQDIAEDLTREALDRLGVSRMDQRLYGKIDYKRARYVFHPEYAVRQALLVDSKAEKEHATATIQTAQTSMRIRHVRAGHPVDVPGDLKTTIGNCLATTIFVKYEYEEHSKNRLHEITIASLPSGLLQEQYNPTPEDTIWRAGRNAPTRGEPFRVRLVFAALKNKMRWRVQSIPLPPNAPPPTPGSFPWDE